MTRLLPILVLLLCGCADRRVTPREVIRTLTPETVQVGLTAPNLFNGPIVANKGNNDSRRDSVGVLGATVSFTYRLKPIRIERSEPQPVQIVPPVPRPAFAPFPKPAPSTPAL